jgi:hypothetical protein
MASMLCLKTDQFLSMYAFGVAYQALSSGDSPFVNLKCADFHIFNSSLAIIAFIHSLTWGSHPLICARLPALFEDVSLSEISDPRILQKGTTIVLKYAKAAAHRETGRASGT